MMRHVAKFLRTGLYTDKLLYTCFRGADLRSRNAVHTRASELIEKGVMLPYPKRFASVLKFWKNVREFTGLFLKFYRPQVFSGMGAPGEADSEEEDQEQDMGKVKIGVVSSAVLDLVWWAYGECVNVVGSLAQDLMMFSRMCPCHPSAVLSRDEHPELQWSAQLRRETGKGTCAASGLQAPYFVVGKHMDVLANAVQSAHVRLLSCLADISSAHRAAVMKDYEKGSLSLAYILHLRCSSFQQLPLLLCGMSHPDELVARGVPQDVVAQYAATEASSRQHPKVCG